MNKLTKLDNFLLNIDNSNIEKNQELIYNINNNINTSFTRTEIFTILILTAYKINVSQSHIDMFPQTLITYIEPYHIMSALSLITSLYYLHKKF